MRTFIFACVHNAGRSQMSAAFFNQLVNPSTARAISAGTHPAEHVHPVVIDAMREVGIDLSQAKPQKLTADLAQNAEMLITIIRPSGLNTDRTHGAAWSAARTRLYDVHRFCISGQLVSKCWIRQSDQDICSLY
ncbi:MAG: hypothetical protein WBX22_27790 [Silvibacterium sp.]